MGLVLLRKLNARNIELYEDTRGETVGVRLRDGEYRYVTWLGFIDRDAAKIMRGKPVKLLICRYGTTGEINVAWEDVPEGKHVQGCLMPHGAYAVVPLRVV